MLSPHGVCVVCSRMTVQMLLLICPSKQCGQAVYGNLKAIDQPAFISILTFLKPNRDAFENIIMVM